MAANDDIFEIDLLRSLGLSNLRFFAEIPHGGGAACGMIAAYNQAVPGPTNLFYVVGKKLTVRGFIVSDHAHREPTFRRHVSGLLRDGKLVFEETHRLAVRGRTRSQALISQTPLVLLMVAYTIGGLWVLAQQIKA